MEQEHVPGTIVLPLVDGSDIEVARQDIMDVIPDGFVEGRSRIVLRDGATQHVSLGEEATLVLIQDPSVVELLAG